MNEEHTLITDDQAKTLADLLKIATGLGYEVKGFNCVLNVELPLRNYKHRNYPFPFLRVQKGKLVCLTGRLVKYSAKDPNLADIPTDTFTRIAFIHEKK